MLFSRKAATATEPKPEPTVPLEHLPAASRPAPAAPDAGSGQAGTRTQSFIDASLTIIGDLHAEGDVRLDGRICGNVRCAQLIVGRDGAITGSITAEQAIVRGRIVGTIRSPVVIIQGTAHVESEITYRMLAIDDGAIFEGAARRVGNPLEEEPVKEEPAAASLGELQRMTLAAESETAGAKDGANGRAATAEAAHLAPPAANGHHTTEHRSSTSHT
jgi:cytoskeletal protein CcmA (bactofilin family)